MNGWTGKLLRVNLTTGQSRVEDIPEAWLRDYIGGRGVGDRYLWEEIDPRVDPLAPENKLIFATGPLTGTPTPCGARYMVVTKGPLTGAITTSNSGGHWGPELKFAGYDLLLLEGRAPHPVYLWIYDDQVELRDARSFRGKPVAVTEGGIRAALGVPNTRVACTRPAGGGRGCRARRPTSTWSTCTRATGRRPARARSTRRPGRWAPTAAWATSTRSSRPTGCATTSAWTRSRWARPWPPRWSCTRAAS